MAMDWSGTDQPFAELPEPLTLLAVEGRWGDPDWRRKIDQHFSLNPLRADA